MMNRASADWPLVVTISVVTALVACNQIRAENQAGKVQAATKQPTTSEIPGDFHGTWAYTDPNHEGSNTLTITRSTIQWFRTCEGKESVREGKYSLKDDNYAVAFQSRRGTSFAPFVPAGKCVPASMGRTTVTLRRKGENLILHLSAAKSIQELPGGTIATTVPAGTYVCWRVK